MINKIYSNNLVKPDQTKLGYNNCFTISLCNNGFFTNNFNNYRLHNKIYGFTGINTEEISFSFSTEWSETAGAKLGSSITKYANSKFIRMFAGKSDNGWMPFIMTDSWTQKKMTGSQPLQLNLKFKLYNENSLAGTNYHDVILFLTHLCSPVKKIDFGNDTLELLKNSFVGAYNVGSEIMEESKNFISAITTNDSKNKKGVIDSFKQSANNLYNDLISPGILGKNNGNFTVVLELNNKIYNKNITLNTIKTNKVETSTSTIDWIITNFNFTPSTQFIWDDKKHLPMPIWCDFTLTLETRLSLSNKYIYDLFNKESIDVNQE